MTVHFILWKWKQHQFRETYTAEHVNIMARMLTANLGDLPHRILCVTDDPAGIAAPVQTFPLWEDHKALANSTGRHLPSCYRRLKLFDFATQKAMGVRHGERLISIDLDSIVLSPLNELLQRIEKIDAPFTGWGVRGTYHVLVFNGSFWSIKCSPQLQHIWSNFNAKDSPVAALKQGFLGSDQGWLSMNFAKSKEACAIRFPDFASYPREVRVAGFLDRRTKVVFFHGARKPWHAQESQQQPWIRKHWYHEKGKVA